MAMRPALVRILKAREIERLSIPTLVIYKEIQDFFHGAGLLN